VVLDVVAADGRNGATTPILPPPLPAVKRFPGSWGEVAKLQSLGFCRRRTTW
jgi:hypothetical protein